LRELGSRTAKRVIRQAVRAAAKPVIKTARQLVPRVTGLLRASLGVRIKTYKRGVVAAIIGPRVEFKSKIREGLEGKQKKQIPANYAHLVEFGTDRHVVVPKHKKAMTINGELRGRAVPESKAKPFLRPAFDRNHQRALNIMRTELWKRINAEVRKLSQS